MIVLASGNRGKIKEFRSVLPDVQLITMAEAGVTEDIPETGVTFEENALIKARAVCKLTGKTAVADDSGLTVIALDGAPGVYSARYAGENATDAQRIEKLLHALDGLETERRGASFVCVIAYVTPEGEEALFRGECHGIITTAPRGTNGFGYDPVFLVPTYGKTFGELDSTIKNKISHRSVALGKLQGYLSPSAGRNDADDILPNRRKD